MADIVPQGVQKKLRACMLCSLVKTQVAFQQDGCENCEQVLNYKVYFHQDSLIDRYIELKLIKNDRGIQKE
jgi:hypothetical protein